MFNRGWTFILGAVLCAPFVTCAVVWSDGNTHSATRHIDIFLDLDGMVVYRSNPTIDPIGSELIEVLGTHIPDGGKFRLIKGAREKIEFYLSLAPRVRLSVFSAGSRDRNFQLLEKLMLPPNHLRTRKMSVAEAIDGRIFSAEHTQTNEFGEVSKDLSLEVIKTALPSFRLSDAVLSDDYFEMAAPGQEDNMLWLPDTSPNSLKHALSNLDPLMAQERIFLSGTNKLLYEMGLMEAAIKLWESSGVSFTDALKTAQLRVGAGGDRDIYFYGTNPKVNAEYYRRGIEIAQTLNPAFHHEELHPADERSPFSKQSQCAHYLTDAHL